MIKPVSPMPPTRRPQRSKASPKLEAYWDNLYLVGLIRLATASTADEELESLTTVVFALEGKRAAQEDLRHGHMRASTRVERVEAIFYHLINILFQ
jgi:hypothetical protein